jgi:hypothetical protein
VIVTGAVLAVTTLTADDEAQPVGHPLIAEHTNNEGSVRDCVGGNGIRPGLAIRFDVINSDTGAFAGAIVTRAARSNCVVNEEGNALFTFLAPGSYQVRAQYVAGNSNQFVFGDVVTNLQVLPQAPAPDPTPYEPPPCYDFYCYY